ELAGNGLDDPQVGLMRDERGDLGRVDPRLLAGLERDRRQGAGGPAENRLALLDDERVPVLDVDLVSQVAVAAPVDRADAGRVGRVRDRADDRGARAVSEDD